MHRNKHTILYFPFCLLQTLCRYDLIVFLEYDSRILIIPFPVSTETIQCRKSFLIFSIFDREFPGNVGPTFLFYAVLRVHSTYLYYLVDININ